MKLHIDREGSTTEREFSGKAKDLLTELDINPATVVITKNGTLITEEDTLENSDEVKIISVVSGG